MNETWRTIPLKPVSRKSTDACLVHIYPTGTALGSRVKLGEKSLYLGREDDCDIAINDRLVSRRHAVVETGPDGFRVRDLGSTNGTFINDAQVSGHRVLRDGDYLRVGNCIYRFLDGGNVEAEYHEEIYRLTIIDGLTQVHNKRYMREFLERELVRAVRHNRPLTVALLDIDHFKRVNDDWGHLVGDYILREIASLATRGVRTEDLFARFGGEEFALVLVETGLDTAREVCERLRQSIATHDFVYDGRPLRVTVSVGLAQCDGESNYTTSDLLQAADENLYKAKAEGRNCVVG